VERFKKILAALDLGPTGDRLTEGSRKALDRAVWIAGRVGASLTLLHSTAPDEYWDAETEGFVTSREAADDRRALLEDAIAQMTAANVESRVVIGSEKAWLAIIREVLRSDIDAVIAAKRTSVASDDRKLGTVARKLLRKCPCAVWLEDPREAADPSLILAATDLGPVGDRVVEKAASVAHAMGAKLHIVHATSLPMQAQMEGGDARLDYEREAREAAIGHIEAVLEHTPLAGAAELHVGLSSPAHAILEGAERLRPGLVVMGTVSRGGTAGVLMGNTAERLIDRLDCALLAVKPEDFVCPVALD